MSKAIAYSASYLDFDAVNDMVTFTVGAGNIASFEDVWILLDSTTQPILEIDDNASKQINLTAGSFSYTGAETLTVTYLEGTMAANKWIKIRITFSAPVTVTSFFRFGRCGSSYFGGGLANLKTTGTLAIDAPFYVGSYGNYFYKLNSSIRLTGISGAANIKRVSGLENGETHGGLPQSINASNNDFIYSTFRYGINYNAAYQVGGNARAYVYEWLQWDYLTYTSDFYPLFSISTSGTNGVEFVVGYQTSTGILQLNFQSFIANKRSFTGALVNRYGKNRVEIIVPNANANAILVTLNGILLTYTGANVTLNTAAQKRYLSSYGGSNIGSHVPVLFEEYNSAAIDEVNLVGRWRNQYRTNSNKGVFFKDLSSIGNHSNIEGIGSPLRCVIGSSDNLIDYSSNDILNKLIVSATQKYWGIYQIITSELNPPDIREYSGWQQLQRTLNFSQGIIAFEIKGYNIADRISQIIIDGRDALSDGILIQINGSSRLEVRYNNQTEAISTALANDTNHLVVVQFTATHIIIEVNDVELKNVAKTASPSTISTTALATIGTNSFGTKGSWFTNMIGRVAILDITPTPAIVAAIKAEFT